MIAKRKRGLVVVPWTFTSESQVALTTAPDLADDPERVHVVHIADCPPRLEIPDPSECRVRKQYQECERRFRDFCRHLPRNAQHSRLHFHVVYGRVAREVASFALRQGASLIVLSSGNRWSMTRFVFGSRSTRIVHAAHCPVLVLKGVAEGIRVHRKKLNVAASIFWGAN